MAECEQRLVDVQDNNADKQAGKLTKRSAEQIKGSSYNTINETRKPRRIIFSQGQDTFLEKQVDNQLYKLQQKPDAFAMIISRFQRHKVQNLALEGVDAGKYTPQFTAVRPDSRGESFSQGIPYTSEAEK